MSDERIVSGNSDGKDESKVEGSLRPQELSRYIGQKALKHELSVYIKAAKLREESLDHVLLYGPPGLGKTTLAHIIANEMGVSLKTTTGPAIEKNGDLLSLLNELQPGDVLFIDEIHRLPKAVEEMLYSAMEDFYVDIVIGQGPTAHPVHFPLPPFTLVGATTRAGLLSPPLRDRFGIVEHMRYYDVSDLEQIIERSARIFNVKIDKTASKKLAMRSRGTPRIANRLLKRVRDFAQVNSQNIIDTQLVNHALDLLGVDSVGLDSIDQKLIKTMLKFYNGGPVGINTLAANVGEEADTIAEMYEPYLLQIGYIKRTARGRVVTKKAYQHFETKNN